MPLQLKKADDVQTVASVTTAAGAANGTTTTAVKLPGMVRGFVFVLDVTAAATDAADTLDVAVQTLLDGTNYVDVVAFTQCLGNGGAKRYAAKVLAGDSQNMFEASAALAAGTVRNIVGDAWRVKYTQVDADNNASFTFSVKALPM
jgi:hypothetical protein